MPVTHLSDPPPLAIPGPLRGPAMETVLPGDRGGRNPHQHVPQGPSTNPGKGASLSLQAGGPQSERFVSAILHLLSSQPLCPPSDLRPHPRPGVMPPSGRCALGLKTAFICI